MNTRCCRIWHFRAFSSHGVRPTGVEVFHLHFLRLLFAARDKAQYVVKGGCNLRFFFGSVRYSEGLDLDVHGASAHALKDRADSILASKVMREVLESADMEIRRVSTPKQTETTQRWKIEIGPLGGRAALHTKIEFSRRAGEGEAALEAVEPRLVRGYRLMPILANHYLLPTAIRQKVGALVGRREVHPSYVSLQTALRLHGMIEQILSVVYVVSLARSHRMRTAFGTFSVHRVAPSFFGGFELSASSGAKVATPEKALLDVCYLSGVRSRLFASLPELTVPPGFRRGAARSWIAKIPSARLRTLVARRFERLTAAPPRPN